MKRASVNKRSYLTIGAILLGAVLLFALGFYGISQWEAARGKFPEQDFGKETIYYNGVTYEKRGNVETFLVLGLDKLAGAPESDSYNNDKQADFLVLLVLDNDQKTCSAIHINRDTMATVNVLGVAGNKIGTVTKQIALAHTYGNGRDVSCRNTADAVSELFHGLKVGHYASLTMDVIPTLNDLVGGVELEILDDFTAIDPTMVKGQTLRLTGEQALTYVRERRGLEDSSNSTRMRRQQQYVRALYDTVRARIDEGDEELRLSLSLTVADYLVSDRSVTQLQTLAEKCRGYTFTGIRDIAGESRPGEKFMEFYPDPDALNALLLELFYQPIA